VKILIPLRIAFYIYFMIVFWYRKQQSIHYYRRIVMIKCGIITKKQIRSH